VTIGFANGCFDLFHAGHEHYLTACRRHCTYLIVAVNSDDYCRRVKGADRPYEPLATRLLHVRAFADAVIPFEGREELLIMEIRPDVVFKGADHSPNQTHYAARVPGWKNGPHGVWKAPVIHIARLDGISTTEEGARRK
jgi:D-beta-D-heptose 7-phosphate kinase / D-beta-D-heptose 1-phosphate adenosyltransferase